MDFSTLSDDEVKQRLATLKGESQALSGQSPQPVAAAPAQQAPQGAAMPSKPSDMSNDQLMARLKQLKSGGSKESYTIQEMHPDFTTADRLIVKNFSTNPESAVDYLKTKHPDLDVQLDPATQQIKAKKKDGSEKDYRVLDPDTGIDIAHPTEILRDLGDVAYDVPSSILTSMATAAGGVAGAPTAVGALPAAAVAGAGTSTALEGLRQTIGSALGLKNNYSGTDLAVAGGTGLASPLLFGSGASGAQMAKAGLSETEQLAQRGAVGRAWDAVTPYAKSAGAKLGEIVSGVPKQTIESYGANAEKIAQMEQNPTAITDLVKNTAQTADKALSAAKEDAWGKVESGVAQAAAEGKTVDLTNVKKPLQDAIDKAEKMFADAPSAANRARLDKLKDFEATFFKDEAGQPISQAGVESAVGLSQDLADAAKFNRMKPDAISGAPGGGRLAATTSAGDKNLAYVAKTLKRALDGELENVLPEGTLEAKKAYGMTQNQERTLGKFFTNTDKAYGVLSNLGNEANQGRQELFNSLDQKYGSNLIDQAKLAQAYKTFARPSAIAITSKGSVSTGRAVPLAGAGALTGYYLGGHLSNSEGGHGSGLFGAAGLGAALGGGLGAVVGGPMAMKAYINAGMNAAKASNMLQQAPRYFGPGQAAGNYMMNNIWQHMGDK